MYPDAYEVGLPNQGLQILYEVLNERPDALAERCYSVWPDLEALMREHGIPRSPWTRTARSAFDLLGVCFSTELGYTNLLTALDLAGIPRTDRDDAPARGRGRARGVQPRADRRLRRRRCARRRRGGRRHHRRGPGVEARRPARRPPDGLLRAPRGVRGSTCPRSTTSPTGPTGAIGRVVPSRSRVRGRSPSAPPMDLDSWPYPKQPLVPLAETVHDRLSVEIFRG